MALQSKKTLTKILERMAPGTELREGLENILSARTGALIAIGDVDRVLDLSDGGFKLDCEFSAQRLFELAKMDGAILLDHDISHILRANVHLVPISELITSETGMRHRTAERVAKQTDALVISISQKRDVISLYLGDVKYALQDIRVLLAKANQALQTLEKYRARLDEVSANLSALEFEDLVTLLDVVNVLQRSEMVQRVSREIERYISELGTEGRLINMQLVELVGRTEEQTLMVIKDYAAGRRRPSKIASELAAFSSDQLLDLSEIGTLLGYKETDNLLDQVVHPRGYRMLNKIPRLPMPVIEKIVAEFKDFQTIMEASIEELDAVDGVGAIRARAIKEGLRRFKEYNILDRYV